MSRRLTVDERREQLLELGTRLFSTHAYDDVSIDDIAREAGVSKGLLYHYFGGKRAFYHATVELEANRLLETLTQDPDVPPADRARDGVRKYLAFVAARSDAYVALMRGGLGRDEQADAIVDRTRQVLADRVLDAIVDGEPPPMLRVASRAWIGTIEAASLDWLVYQDVEPDALVEVLLAALGGLLGAASASLGAPATGETD